MPPVTDVTNETPKPTTSLKKSLRGLFENTPKYVTYVTAAVGGPTVPHGMPISGPTTAVGA